MREKIIALLPRPKDKDFSSHANCPSSPESDKGHKNDLRPKKHVIISDLDVSHCMNDRSNGVLPWILEGSVIILNLEEFSGKVFTCLAEGDATYR